MTQEERIELLKQVAEVAPEGCRGEYRDLPYEKVVLKIDRGDTERWIALELYDEYEDAEAIIAMLDAIQAKEDKSWVRLGYYPDIAQSPYNVVVYYESPDGLFIRESEGFGATRAEAVARAFVEVFSK